MGLFDIFKRKKKNEQEEAVQDELIQENKAENGEESGVGEDVTAETDLTNDTAAELETETAEPETKLEGIADEAFVAEKAAAETETAEAAETEIIAETASVMPEAEDGVAENDDSMDEAEEIPAEQETEEAPADESTDGYVIDENDGSEEDCEKFVEKPKEKLGFFGRLKLGLKKTRDDFGGKMASVFTFGRKIDEDFYEDLEETLIRSDVGVRTAMELADRLRDRQKADKIKDTQVLQKALEEEIESILLAKGEEQNKIKIENGKLNIILIVGVNGAGKTTTIGKMAHYYKTQGKKVLLAAADTFRAAAIEQLCEWGERVHVPVIRQSDGSDPGAVVFDACRAAASRKTDVLIVDTAGRLQNKKNLMEELKKIDKIIGREAPDANVECLLVLDSGTGQNAISQAKLFGEVVPLTGIILTKLDGTAKGGVVIGITNELNLPVKMIGVGESMDDLREFVPSDFARALFEEDNEEASNYDPLQEN